MSCSREGFDLFTSNGRHSFFRDLRKGRFNPLMWGDTFGRFQCMVFGHKPYDSNFGGTPDFACRQCHKYLPHLNRTT